MQIWEYKIAILTLQEKGLNSLGEQGWELVGFVLRDNNSNLQCVFKRPKPDTFYAQP